MERLLGWSFGAQSLRQCTGVLTRSDCREPSDLCAALVRSSRRSRGRTLARRQRSGCQARIPSLYTGRGRQGGRSTRRTGRRRGPAGSRCSRVPAGADRLRVGVRGSIVDRCPLAGRVSGRADWPRGTSGRQGRGRVRRRGLGGTRLGADCFVRRRCRTICWRPGDRLLVGSRSTGLRPGSGLLVGGHVHVPPDGVRWVGTPDGVESSFGWVLPGCGIANRPLPRLIHRRRFTVLCWSRDGTAPAPLACG
jgi:hypothetical protein